MYNHLQSDIHVLLLCLLIRRESYNCHTRAWTACKLWWVGFLQSKKRSFAITNHYLCIIVLTAERADKCCSLRWPAPEASTFILSPVRVTIITPYPQLILCQCSTLCKHYCYLQNKDQGTGSFDELSAFTCFLLLSSALSTNTTVIAAWSVYKMGMWVAMVFFNREIHVVWPYKLKHVVHVFSSWILWA